MSAAAVEIIDDRLRVVFNHFGPADYALFLKVKRLPEYSLDVDPERFVYTITAPARFAPMLGVDLPPDSRQGTQLHSAMLDDQSEITRQALAAKRFACWSDCGLGKTFIELEYARQVVAMTGGRVLLVTLNEVIQSILEERNKFYGNTLPITIIESRQHMKDWCAGRAVESECTVCRAEYEERKAAGDEQLTYPSLATACLHTRREIKIAIVNYEKFNYRGESEQIVNELRNLAGIVLDESSRLKSGGGKQKWSLIKSARGIEYKLSCTATPAPNDIMEFASQASFLEKLRDQNEIIWTYFTRDSKTHRWTVKTHARQAFFAFMAGWSIYVRDPRRFGWRMNVEPPPEPDTFIHQIRPTDEQRQFILDFNSATAAATGGDASMFADKELNATTSIKCSQAAKGFVYERDNGSDPEISGSDIPTGDAAEADGNAIDVGDGSGGLRDDQGISQQPMENEANGESTVAARRPAARKSRQNGQRRTGARRVRRIASEKPATVARLIQEESNHDYGVLVWTVFDEETNIIADQLKGVEGVKFETLTGRTPKSKRDEIIERFRRGETRVLITRASMLGYGRNFQHCGAMIFSGWTFSYEQFYQAVRRAYRHGQTRKLRVHVPIIPELEGQMYEAIVRKDAMSEAAIAVMETNYIAARNEVALAI